MFSLRFPIALKNNLITYPPKRTTKPAPSSHYLHSINSQSHLFPSQSMIVTKCDTMAVVANNIPKVALGDEVEGGTSLDEDLTMPAELKMELMPKHVAVIMDGNRRWAEMRGLPLSEGHVAGMKSLKRMVKLCLSWEIKVLTIFMFSTDNWARSKVEVEFLFSLVERIVNSEIEAIMRERIKISMIGDSSKLPESLQRMITNVEESTKNHSKLQIIAAINYGGKHDVVQACKSVTKKVQDGLLHLEDINENIVEKELQTNCTEFPYPDLLIRTSGELRVSNFLLWQLAYTEFFFNQQLWPDFGKSEFVEALSSFQKRQRRYGGRHSSPSIQ
ncbi:unnamed protein product [Trifolium pratense]|uniref:Uncharacterized protein n=1 Tax=Trifolium pratense TaxID=57577 RepID=A0ACB0K818_TRIPR|nr:unnamed protein product [Trifolium pratense]